MATQVARLFCLLVVILCLEVYGIDAARFGASQNTYSSSANVVSGQQRAHQERIGRSAEQDVLDADDIFALTQSKDYYESMSSSMYSGFLAVGGENEGGALHYFFAETVESPETAPLVLWLNGGPGASSFGGSILEHGTLNT